MYRLERGEDRIALTVNEGNLVAPHGALPEGAFSLVEERMGSTREVADVFIAAPPPDASSFEAVREIMDSGGLAATDPITTTVAASSRTAVLYLCVFLLILLSADRLVRRRA
jgi:hypothetical protein